MSIERLLAAVPQNPAEAQAQPEEVKAAETPAEAPSAELPSVEVQPVSVSEVRHLVSSCTSNFSSQVTQEPEAPVSAHEPVLPSVAFVRDVTLPDGSTHPCHAKLVKTWEVRNDGQTAWPADSKLVLNTMTLGFVSLPFCFGLFALSLSLIA